MVSYNQNVYFHNQIISVDSRVFSEMKNRFAFRSLEKTAKFHEKKMQKFWGKKVENIAKKYGREIINYDIMQLLMLSFWAEYFRKIRQFFSYFNSWKNAKFREKVCKKRSKIFAFFLRKFSFAGNPIIQIRGHFLCKTISIRLWSWSGY